MDIWNELEKFISDQYSCIVCSSDSFSLWAKQNYLEAKKCKKCGMISVNPHLSKEGLDFFYKNYLKNRLEDKLLSKQRESAYIIDKNWLEIFIDTGKILDVGCSGGFFLNKFDPKKWIRKGIEITNESKKFAKENFNIDVLVGNFIDLNIEETFDVITFRGVIEHFSDPVTCLKKAVSILKKNAYLFISATPNGSSFGFYVYREKWRLFTPLEHIHFFSIKHLDSILSKMNMKLVTWHYQYEETPYANIENDYDKMIDDIILTKSDRKDEIQLSNAFPGNMLTAIWRKN